MQEDDEAASPNERQGIQWLGESMVPDTSHWFVVPGERIAGVLVAEVRGNGGLFFRREIAVPPLDGLVAVADSGKPPVISDVRVLEIRRGLFLSATIGWQTDTVTDGRVRYGQMDLAQTSSAGSRLGRRHHIVLHDLKPGKTYGFSAVSNDLFGRSRTAEPFTFATTKSFTAPLPAVTGDGQASEGDVVLESRFQRLGSDYLLDVRISQPSLLAIGVNKVDWKQGISAMKSEKTGEVKEFHPVLNSTPVTSMTVCGNCHQNQATASHPVNVYPKPGMIIPPEYPTLPDGRITCISCHENHGSNYRYRLIKPGQRELCTGCHRDMR